MKPSPFFENVVIITGASAGIGRELALQLADQGAWSVLAARSIDELEAVAERCRQRGGQALVVPTDVAVQAQCQNLIERAIEAYGRIDTLINNAGIRGEARFDEIQDLALVERVMRVNYLGSVVCTYYALPYLKESRGRIVGVSSASGKWGVPTRAAYAASKHAMAGFFDSLRIELDGSGVSVTVVYPGFVATVWPESRPGVMPVETCVRLILRAVALRRRELVMPFSTKVGLWLKLIVPGLFDRIVQRVFRGVPG